MKIKHQGYTLLEMLMVMGIVGILIGVSVSAFLSARLTARDARRKTDLEQIRGALETYKTDNNVYPGPLSSPALTSDNANVLSSFLVGGSNQYISQIPSDPTATMNYYYVTTPTGYFLCASLEGLSQVSTVNCSTADCGSMDGEGRLCNYEVKNP